MVGLDRNFLHEGRGVIIYNGGEVGKADEVHFMFHGLGFDYVSEDDANSCYGTISGAISKVELIPEFNSPEPTPVTLDIVVSDEEGEETRVRIGGVEFIGSILKSGKLDDVEFHGKVEV